MNLPKNGCSQQKFCVEILEPEEVVSLNLKGARKIVKTKKATYEAQVVIIASGTVGCDAAMAQG